MPCQLYLNLKKKKNRGWTLRMPHEAVISMIISNIVGSLDSLFMTEETWTQNWSLWVSLFAFVHSFTQRASADLLPTALGTKCPPPCPQVAESLPSLSLTSGPCLRGTDKKAEGRAAAGKGSSRCSWPARKTDRGYPVEKTNWPRIWNSKNRRPEFPLQHFLNVQGRK